MTNFKLGKIVQLGLVLILGATVQTVFAHDVTGTLLTGQGSRATDYYRIDCSLDQTAASQSPTHHLGFSVNDGTATGGVLNAQVTTTLSGGSIGRAAIVTDIKGGDGVSSVTEIVNTLNYTNVNSSPQDVSFFASVSKSAKSNKNYVLTYHCQDEFGQHTGTNITQLQNQ